MQKWQMQKFQDYCTFQDPGKMFKVCLQKTPKWSYLYVDKVTKLLLCSVELNVGVEWAEQLLRLHSMH